MTAFHRKIFFKLHMFTHIKREIKGLLDASKEITSFQQSSLRPTVQEDILARKWTILKEFFFSFPTTILLFGFSCDGSVEEVQVQMCNKI